MLDENGQTFTVYEKDTSDSENRIPRNSEVIGASVVSSDDRIQQTQSTVKIQNESSIGVDTDTETPAGTEIQRTQEQGRTSQNPLQDTDNTIYRSGMEEADYGEALPDGYSEYDIVQEMLSDARGTMNDFKGNTKLKAELDEEVRKQIGERRTGSRGSGSNRSELSTDEDTESRRKQENFADMKQAVREVLRELGSVLYGEQAVEEGLIDELGGLDRALAYLHGRQ